MTAPAWLYIVRLTSGGLYIGFTRDLDKRMAGHEGTGDGATTTGDRSVGLLYVEEHPNVTSALKRERQIKRWTRAKKEALVSGDVEMLRHLSRRGG